MKSDWCNELIGKAQVTSSYKSSTNHDRIITENNILKTVVEVSWYGPGHGPFELIHCACALVFLKKAASRLGAGHELPKCFCIQGP